MILHVVHILFLLVSEMHNFSLGFKLSRYSVAEISNWLNKEPIFLQLLNNKLVGLMLVQKEEKME